MACKTSCQLCSRLIISESVAFTDGNLVIDLPAGAYSDGGKYCIVVAQSIPTDTTINAPVYITIGGGTVLYPLDKCDCTQAVACSIRTRTRYATRVNTTATGGTFKLLGRVCCAPDNSLTAIDGTDGGAAT